MLTISGISLVGISLISIHAQIPVLQLDHGHPSRRVLETHSNELSVSLMLYSSINVFHYDSHMICDMRSSGCYKPNFYEDPNYVAYSTE